MPGARAATWLSATSGLLGGALLAGCAGGGGALPPEESVQVPNSGSVVIYVDAPRHLAGPVLKMFGEQTGITVEAHYRQDEGDGFEAALSSESKAGKVDLLWADAPLLAARLTRAGLTAPFRPAGARPIPSQYRDRGFQWIGFAVNPRVILFNQTLVSRETAPQSVDDLTTGRWAGQASLTKIASGPGGYWAAALFGLRGDERGKQFFDTIAKTGNHVVASDAEVRRQVASGEAAWGIVSLDQAICAKRQAEPVNIFFPDRMGMGVVAVPQVAALIRGAPHPAQAKGLYGYLFATETAWQVGQNDCALLSLLPVTEMAIPKPEWVPLLGALNIMAVDNDLAYESYLRNAAYFAAWSGGPTAR